MQLHQTLTNIVIPTFYIKLLHPTIISSYQVQSPLVNMEVWYVGPKRVCHTPILNWYYIVNKRMNFLLPLEMSKNSDMIISLSQVVNGIMNMRTIKSFTAHEVWPSFSQRKPIEKTSREDLRETTPFLC